MKTRKSLLVRAQNDPGSKAWYTLFEIYQPLVENWLKSRGINETDVADISQEVMLALSQKLRNFEHNNRTGAFRNWLKTITIHRCRRHWDKNKRKREIQGHQVEKLLEQASDPNSELSIIWDREHDLHVLKSVLQIVKNEFDPKVYSVFHRTAFTNLPAKQIADEFGISTGQVYKYKFRVMKRITEEAGPLIDDSEFLRDQPPPTDLESPSSG